MALVSGCGYPGTLTRLTLELLADIVSSSFSPVGRRETSVRFSGLISGPEVQGSGHVCSAQSVLLTVLDLLIAERKGLFPALPESIPWPQKPTEVRRTC